MSKDCRSKETGAFEAGDELEETGCIEMASVDSNALEIGAVQLPERVAEFIELEMPGKAKSYRPASGKLLPDSDAR